MEKYIKNLSIANMILTTMFFLGMYGAASLEGSNAPQFISTTLIVGANLLFYVVPLSYMLVFGICMTSLFKKIINSQNRFAQKNTDKFPIVWFALSSFSFVGYFLFVNMILNSY